MKCWFARAQDNFCPYYQGLGPNTLEAESADRVKLV